MNAAISSVIRAQASNPASTGKTESETLKSTEQITGGQNIAVESSVSSKYDTVELSKEYVEYKTQGQNSTLQDQTSQLNSTVIRFLASNSEEKVYSYQLYSYTETELLDMLSSGTISRQAYDAEIADRDTPMIVV